jgi:peptidoglycan/xylan/chitin deacetylase (PgdA/CDA1 family)
MRFARTFLTFCLATTAGFSAPREVAITFDDLPSTHTRAENLPAITKKLLSTITANRIPVIGFVNEQKLYVNGKLDPRRVDLLRQWLAAGANLGNHTFSHVAIDRVPLEEYQRDVIRGETVTKSLLAAKGKKLTYFRHPQLRTGPDDDYRRGLDTFLRQRGYTVAPVTIDNNEYIFADIYSRARARGDAETMKRVADAYLVYMEEIFSFFERLSVEFLGREVKQTLLLHANELNADYFDELVTMMKRRGYRFISLEEALKDPAYKNKEAQSKRGLSWLHRWMLARGLELKPEPLEPEFIRRLFNESRSSVVHGPSSVVRGPSSVVRDQYHGRPETGDQRQSNQ